VGIRERAGSQLDRSKEKAQKENTKKVSNEEIINAKGWEW